MENLGFSPSQFADEIGLKRSSLSHILSGRNNPSLDVVLKIKTRFNEINTDWLLFGVGSEMVGSGGIVQEKSTKKVDVPETIQQQLAFGSKPVLKDEPKKPNKEVAPLLQKASASNGEVERIIVMYNDKTFEFYGSR